MAIVVCAMLAMVTAIIALYREMQTERSYRDRSNCSHLRYHKFILFLLVAFSFKDTFYLTLFKRWFPGCSPATLYIAVWQWFQSCYSWCD